MEINLVVST